MAGDGGHGSPGPDQTGPTGGPPVSGESTPPRSGWRQFLFSWKGGLSAVVGGVGVAATLYSNVDKLWPPIKAVFVPADVHVALLQCKLDKIVIELTNSGGRNATVDDPTFRINSTLLGSNDLLMEQFVRPDPFDRYDRNVSPNDPDRISYSSRDPNTGAVTPFFSDDEVHSGHCEIQVSVPVRGRSEPVGDSCPCGR
jgi:hypothetical protein